MKKNSFEKYPIFRYLCCLLAVSVLFTAVTFSRYSLSSSGSSSVDIAGFNCSYSIKDFSSFSFSNADYFLKINDDETEFGEPVYLDFTMSNYRSSGNNILYSGVDVQGSMKITIPKDFAENLAVQFEYVSQDKTVNDTSTNDTNGARFTPQIVLSELFYGTYSDGNGKTGTYYNYDEGNNLTSTNQFSPYGDSDRPDEDIKVSGSLNNKGTITVKGKSMELKVYTAYDSTDYSISFMRNQDTLPGLYLDLTKQEEYYVLELTMPEMKLPAVTSEDGDIRIDKNFRAHFTLTNRLQTDASWTKDDTSYDYLITTPPTSKDDEDYIITHEDEKITVRGFHFDQTTTYTDGTETTVRVQCLYDYEGGLSISLYHVAPVDNTDREEELNYVHHMTFTYNGETVTQINYKGKVTDLVSLFSGTGTCGSQYARKINISDLTINPLGEDIEIGNAVNRSYRWNFTAAFVQTSTAGGNA